MKGRFLIKLFLLISIISTSVVSTAFLQTNRIASGDQISISQNELKQITGDNALLKVTSTQDDSESCTLIYKFLDIFTIKKVKATIVEDDYVYVGGEPIGVRLGIDNLIITGKQEIIMPDGKVSDVNTQFLIGDKIVKVDSQKINCVEDLKKAILAFDGTNPLIFTVERNAKEVVLKIYPYIDFSSGGYQLGLYLREGIEGIGTLTFVKEDGHYGALGHPISKSIDDNTTTIKGNITESKIYGINKGTKGHAGELRGIINRNKAIGTIEKNNNYGIFGEFNGEINDKIRLPVGNRKEVHIGKAYIYSTVNGSRPKKYDIEIVKATYQNEAGEKGMVIKITDKALLDNTGGIVQGMSGSPIIQDDKLVGAVSHVFLNDSTRGYGMYIDWMIDN